MSFEPKCILDELTPSIISQWLKSHEINVVQFSDNHKLSKTEKMNKKRIITVRPIPSKARSFYFIDSDDSSKRHIVMVYKDLTMTYCRFILTPEKVELDFDDRNNFIYPSLLEIANSSSWTVFLINMFGDILWNYYFFKQLDDNIIRDYLLSAQFMTNPDTDILLLVSTDYFKVYYFIDDKGYENRIQVNYKLECLIFRTVSRICDWNCGRKRPPVYTTVLGNIELNEYLKQKYYDFVFEKE